MENYKEIKTIGKGNFGTATLCRNLIDNNLYVLKTINTNQFTEDQITSTKLEVELLKNLQHPYIVKYIDSFIKDEVLVIVLEYAEGGDLNKLFKQQRKLGIPFKAELVLLWFTQLCFALKFIHDKKIIHRDIKLSNIFLTSNGDVKLGDFGIAKVLSNTNDFALSIVGTPYYISPEACLKKPYNSKCDIWSLGCVLYELVTLEHAFDAENIGLLCVKISKGQYKKIDTYSHSYSNYFPVGTAEFIDRILCLNPQQRPDVDDLLNDRLLFKYMKINLLNHIQTEKKVNIQSNCQSQNKVELNTISLFEIEEDNFSDLDFNYTRIGLNNSSNSDVTSEVLTKPNSFKTKTNQKVSSDDLEISIDKELKDKIARTKVYLEKLMGKEEFNRRYLIAEKNKMKTINSEKSESGQSDKKSNYVKNINDIIKNNSNTGFSGINANGVNTLNVTSEEETKINRLLTNLIKLEAKLKCN